MAKLNAAERKKIPSSKFGLPKERKFPVEDKAHARAAKSRASEAEHKGRISKGEEDKIDRKADKVLKKSGSHPKGCTCKDCKSKSKSK